GAFTYELTWRGEGEHGQPFLAGLTDPASLTYDGNRSAPQAGRSGAGRPPVGARSATGRDAIDEDEQGADLHEQHDSGAQQGLLLRAVPGGT
ncbi:hypothetical protein, partial [Intrasporangium sp.]|uniref:hypothetical protein n=1 Tax=Intrasporangium sp. TaxID=1925024 RepID=UPI002939AF1E